MSTAASRQSPAAGRESTLGGVDNGMDRLNIGFLDFCRILRRCRILLVLAAIVGGTLETRDGGCSEDLDGVAKRRPAGYEAGASDNRPDGFHHATGTDFDLFAAGPRVAGRDASDERFQAAASADQGASRTRQADARRAGRGD